MAFAWRHNTRRMPFISPASHRWCCNQTQPSRPRPPSPFQPSRVFDCIFVCRGTQMGDFGHLHHSTCAPHGFLPAQEHKHKQAARTTCVWCRVCANVRSFDQPFLSTFLFLVSTSEQTPLPFSRLTAPAPKAPSAGCVCVCVCVCVVEEIGDHRHGGTTTA